MDTETLFGPTKVTRWVVIGECGLYTGQWLTRRDAIYWHTHDTGRKWDYCKRKGDKAIKATITYQKQPQKP